MIKIYTETENNIEYLIIESNKISYFKNIILNNFLYKIPKKYRDYDNMKLIYHKDKNIETCYFYKKKEHNIFGPSYISIDKSTGWLYREWYLNGYNYTNMTEWIKDKDIILRSNKLSYIQKRQNLSHIDKR